MESGRRNRKPRGVAGLALAGLLILAIASTGVSSGIEDDPDYISVTDLDPSRLDVGTNVVTYGLYGGRIDNTIVLKGCFVLFVIDPDAMPRMDLEKLTETGALRVEGVVAYREATNTYYIKVLDLEPAGDFRSKVVQIIENPASTPGDLTEVGFWARRHAKDLDDERLGKLADAAFVTAFRREDALLGETDYEGRFAIAEKVETILDNPGLREFYVRKGINSFLTARGSTTAQTYYDAAVKAEQYLPGGTLTEQLIEDGFAIESGGREGRSAADYYALAAKAREIFGPGVHYDRLTSKALDAEYAGIDKNDYAQLYALARKARETYPAYSEYRNLVLRALAAEKASMDEEDSQAWIRLGNRILYFLDDAQQAGTAFKTASRLDPTNAEAREKLRELGFVFYQGTWWRAEEFGRSDMFKRAQELEDLAASGKIVVGMNREQVLRAWGRPDETFQAAGGWGVSTQWLYRKGESVSFVTLMADTVVSKGESAAANLPQ